jgi:hypothetical protein
MANTKISSLTSSATPLVGTEVLPIVQGSVTKQVSVANLTAGRTVAMSNATIGIGGTTSFATGIVLNGTSNAANGAYIQGQRNSSAAWFLGDTSAALGSGTGYITYVYGANPFIVYTNNGEALNITSSQDIKATLGNFVQGTAAKGINFTANTPAAGMTSQLLNWYEEGTFTPTLTFGGGSTGLVYNGQSGWYKRIGNCVQFTLFIQIQQVGSSTGSAAVGGLPFVSSNTNDRYYVIPVVLQNSALLTGAPHGLLPFNASTINLYQTATSGQANVTNANFQTYASNNLIITGTYQV